MGKWVRRAGIGLCVLLGLLGVLFAWEWKGDLPLETLKARWAGPPSRFVDVDGMSVHYRDEGSGPTLVLLFRLGGLPLVGRLLAHMDPRMLVERTVRQIYGDPTLVTPDLIERNYELTLAPGNREAFGAQTSVPFEDRTALLRSLHVPTLVMWGDKDALIPVSDAQRFAADIPSARVRIYEGLGHVPMEEDGARTVADVREFLEGR